MKNLASGRLACVAWCVLQLSGCQAASVDPMRCSKDADCPRDQTCSLEPQDGAKQAIVLPPPCDGFTPCSDETPCRPMEICVPGEPIARRCKSKICITHCETAGCPADQVCGSDGLCAFVTCGEDGAPVCREHYRCDPPAAATANTAPMQGAEESDIDTATRAASRGCVRSTCKRPERALRRHLAARKLGRLRSVQVRRTPHGLRSRFRLRPWRAERQLHRLPSRDVPRGIPVPS